MLLVVFEAEFADHVLDDISLDRSAHSIVTTVSVPRDRLVRDTTAPPPADRGA